MTGAEPLHPPGLLARREADGGQGGLRAREVPVGHLAPDPAQPRRRIDPEDLAELVASVRAVGIVQPIVVTPHPDPAARRSTPLQILLGERRWAAARAAGLEGVPVVVRAEPLTAGERLMLQLEENDGELRRELPLYDRAIALARVVQLSGLPKQELARRMGKSPSMLAKYLGLARAKGLMRDALQEGHLRGFVAAQLFASLPAEAQGRLLAVARRTRSPITDNQIEAAARRGEGAGADGAAGEERRTARRGAAAEERAEGAEVSAGVAAADRSFAAGGGDESAPDEDGDGEAPGTGAPAGGGGVPAAANATARAIGQQTTVSLRRADFRSGLAGRVGGPGGAGDADTEPGGTGAATGGGNGVPAARSSAIARAAMTGGGSGLLAAATEALAAGVLRGTGAADGGRSGAPPSLAETPRAPLPSRAAAGFLDAGSTIARTRGAMAGGLAGGEGDREIVHVALTRGQLATLIRLLGGTPRGDAEDQIRQLCSLLI